MRTPKPQRPKLRVVCFSPYPAEAPSVYHRVWAYRHLWGRRGVDLTLWPFMSDRFYGIRRTFGPLATLRKAFHFALSTLVLLCRIFWVRRYDRVIIHREVFPLGPPILERLVTSLHPDVTYDLDDAMWHPPSNPVNQRRLLQDEERVGKIMRSCKRVVAGNQYIRDYALGYTSRVFVIPTPYDDLALPASRRARKNEKPIVVWIGNLGNAQYLEPILPALEEVHSKQPFVLRLIGGADIEDVASDSLPIERLAWHRDKEARWLQESDVGIMPLHQNDFEQGKCAFKIIQYFSAGVPAVASPVGMNSQVITPGVNGYLASTRDEWVECLSALLRDASKRGEMSARAREAFRAAYTREINADRWLRLLLPAPEPTPPGSEGSREEEPVP